MPIRSRWTIEIVNRYETNRWRFSAKNMPKGFRKGTISPDFSSNKPSTIWLPHFVEIAADNKINEMKFWKVSKAAGEFFHLRNNPDKSVPIIAGMITQITPYNSASFRVLSHKVSLNVDWISFKHPDKSLPKPLAPDCHHAHLNHGVQNIDKVKKYENWVEQN